MTDATRILVETALPPLTLPSRRMHRARSAGLPARLGRATCVCAALALPTLGIAVADTVRRAGDPRVTQAAAPVSPLGRAAAPVETIRSPRDIPAEFSLPRSGGVQP